MLDQAFTRFWQPLEAAVTTARPLLVRDDIDAVFGHMAPLLPLNRILLLALEERVAHWSLASTIGDVFVQWSQADNGAFQVRTSCGDDFGRTDRLLVHKQRVYEQYTVNYHIAMSRLQQSVVENAKFAAWLQQVGVLFVFFLFQN